MIESGWGGVATGDCSQWRLVLSPPENTVAPLQKKCSPQSALPSKKCSHPSALPSKSALLSKKCSPQSTVASSVLLF